LFESWYQPKAGVPAVNSLTISTKALQALSKMWELETNFVCSSGVFSSGIEHLIRIMRLHEQRLYRKR
jgi:hypothetical protein